MKHEMSEEEYRIFGKPEILEDRYTHFCPGCGHGIIQRLVGEVLDELNIQEKTICVSSIGCTVTSYNYFKVDGLESAHGRAPAVASAIKRCRPDVFAFTIQGDGDLASIGMAEIVHAAARGEKFTVIFANNATYGMTGGQIAPTTLMGMYSASTPGGRTAEQSGYPINVSEMLATLSGPSYITRVAVHTPANVRKTKKAINLAFRAQLAGLGLSLVEVLTMCPINWKVEPRQAPAMIAEKMIPQFPLGEYKIIPEVEALRKGDNA